MTTKIIYRRSGVTKSVIAYDGQHLWRLMENGAVGMTSNPISVYLRRKADFPVISKRAARALVGSIVDLDYKGAKWFRDQPCNKEKFVSFVK